MSSLKDKERIEYFDYLVRHRMTGTPAQCAEKLKLSRSRFYEFLEDLKLMNIPVAYNPEKKTLRIPSGRKNSFWICIR